MSVGMRSTESYTYTAFITYLYMLILFLDENDC